MNVILWTDSQPRNCTGFNFKGSDSSQYGNGYCSRLRYKAKARGLLRDVIANNNNGGNEQGRKHPSITVTFV